MIDIEDIKTKAVNLAKEFINDEKCIEKLQDKIFTPCEWWLLIELTQIYYNLIQETITRDEAKAQQNRAIEFVQNHADIFSELED